MSLFGYKRIEFFQNRMNNQVVSVKLKNDDSSFIVSLIQGIMNNSGYNFTGFYQFYPGLEAEIAQRIILYVVKEGQCLLSLNIPKVFEVSESLLQEIKDYYQAEKVLLFENMRFEEL